MLEAASGASFSTACGAKPFVSLVLSVPGSQVTPPWSNLSPLIPVVPQSCRTHGVALGHDRKEAQDLAI